MLIEREILTQIPQTVCAQIQTGAKVLSELVNNNYDVAIIDSGMQLEGGLSLLKQIRSARPDQLIILTAPDGPLYPGKDSSENGRSVLIVKDGTFHLRIPKLIDGAVRNGSFDDAEGRPRLRMSSRRKADVIKIAASTLAHEINNPLMTILGMTELLLEDPGISEDGNASNKVKVIQESARRIQETMNNLADVSRPTIRQTDAGGLISAGPPDRVK